MNSNYDEKKSSTDEKLDEILKTVVHLKVQIHSLDERLSHLEGDSGNKQSIIISNSSSSETVDQTDFDNLDEHLKRTYQFLANAQEPLTASDVAEQMGRSRSTISYHLNRLKELDFLEKVPSEDRDRSRNVFFRTKERTYR
ncbi:MAG: helix-turn-helix domain-containing protein [Candidatus Hodarchaeales archaeon]|jgi:DNA-binding transcriptional ArsR family regulator